MNTAPAPSCRMLAPVSGVSWAVVLAPAPLPPACTMQPPVRITSESHCLALRDRLNRIWNIESTSGSLEFDIRIYGIWLAVKLPYT